jgi:transposase-like protein
LLKAMTTTGIESALEEELSEHLGYHRHDPQSRGSGPRLLFAIRRLSQQCSNSLARQ